MNGRLRSDRSRARTKNRDGARFKPLKLASERLESRMMLAADVSVFHNTMRPHDVNSDGMLTPLDALVTITALNRGTSLEGILASRGSLGEEAEATPLFRFDTNFDGQLTPLDAMRVINQLNSHGEGGTPVMEYILRTFNAAGTQEISEIGVGQQFQLRVYVHDLRNLSGHPGGMARGGVFSGYTDVLFNSNLVAASGPIQHNHDEYGFSPSGTISNGVIDGAGSFSDSITPLGDDEFLLWSVNMTTQQAGIVTFDGQPATDSADPGDANGSPSLDTGIYGNDFAVCPSSSPAGCEGEMVHVDAVLKIGIEPAAGDDTASVPEDSSQNRLNVLENDVLTGSGTVSIVSVTQGSRGGGVVNHATHVSYTPPANFNGQELFTYAVANGQGETETFTVTVTIVPVDDPVTIVVPTVGSVQSNQNSVLQGIRLQDIDSGNSNVKLTLSVTQGRLTIGTVGVIVTGNATSSLEITGSPAAINAMLNHGLVYRSNLHFAGTETLTARVADASTATHTASTEFAVVDLTGNEIAGEVFHDSDADGVRDANELGFGGVRITLTGTDFQNRPITLFTTTSADGSYSFRGLMPGSYVLTESQPVGVVDGADLFGAGVIGLSDDRASILLEHDGQFRSRDILFAELGFEADLVRTSFPLLASSANANSEVGLVIGQTPSGPWSSFRGDAWSGFHDPRLTILSTFTANDRRHAIVTLTIRDSAGIDRTVTLDSSTNPRLIYTEQAGMQVFAIRGLPSGLFE